MATGMEGGDRSWGPPNSPRGPPNFTPGTPNPTPGTPKASLGSPKLSLGTPKPHPRAPPPASGAPNPIPGTLKSFLGTPKPHPRGPAQTWDPPSIQRAQSPTLELSLKPPEVSRTPQIPCWGSSGVYGGTQRVYLGGLEQSQPLPVRRWDQFQGQSDGPAGPANQRRSANRSAERVRLSRLSANRRAERLRWSRPPPAGVGRVRKLRE